jgi:ribonuclease HI
MSVPAPHFLLYAEAAPSAAAVTEHARNATEGVPYNSSAGRWRFVLKQPGGETSLEAADEEPEATPQRLELLAVVRGLEALSQPSRVTLLTGSRYLRRGLDFGISQWRESDWQWERYGRMTPVKNSDLWQRLDRLLNIHALECKPTRLEKADDLTPPPSAPRNGLTRAQRSGRVVRIDTAAGAAKHQSSSCKSPTNPKSKKKNVRKVAGKRRWNFAFLDLFDAWSRVPGHLARLTTGIICRPLAHILRPTNRES